jgi:hypothetical protein
MAKQRALAQPNITDHFPWVQAMHNPGCEQAIFATITEEPFEQHVSLIPQQYKNRMHLQHLQQYKTTCSISFLTKKSTGRVGSRKDAEC